MKHPIIYMIRFYGYLLQVWERKSTHKWLSMILVAAFLISLSLSLLKEWNFLPASWAYLFPKNIFQAIEISFTLVLIIEVIGMVFSISSSVSSSLVKQLEILSLILLRSAFKQFGEFYDQINWIDFDPIIGMLSDAFGAMVIFIIIY